MVSWAFAGPPKIMGIGPVPATEAALARAGLTLADMEVIVIELNEAFAAQALAVMREWTFAEDDLGRTNVHGSGISLGAIGVRILARCRVNSIAGRHGTALETMCIGGGQGRPRSSSGQLTATSPVPAPAGRALL